jgi:hypothetical protein
VSATLVTATSQALMPSGSTALSMVAGSTESIRQPSANAAWISSRVSFRARPGRWLGSRSLKLSMK